MVDKIRIGLIGASVKGTWSARSHLPAVQASADVELTAVCTTKADTAEAARQAYGARLAFDDWRKMIASPEIDAVAVVVRVPSHVVPAAWKTNGTTPDHRRDWAPTMAEQMVVPLGEAAKFCVAGARFGRLIVLGEAAPNRWRNRCLHVRCACGTERSVSRRDLLRGHTRICGQYRYHRMTQHPAYTSWRAMLVRCRTSSQDQNRETGGSFSA